jgi:hypothetical protein
LITILLLFAHALPEGIVEGTTIVIFNGMAATITPEASRLAFIDLPVSANVRFAHRDR